MDSLSFAQKQRLAYIDFSLLFKGKVTRQDLIRRFETGLSAASRDFTLYKQMAAANVDYDTQSKTYVQTKDFKPLFEHDPKTTLIKLANQISDGMDGISDISFPVEAASQLNVPDIFVVARIVQAILNNKPVNIIYTSLTNGSASREIVPHAIIDNGLRWHVRGFDRKSQSFRDFVLTRISQAKLLEQPIAPFEHKLEDHQWMRMMPLKLVPHPKNIEFSTAIEMDYGMQDGVLQLNVRAALAGYLLRRWNVDCTEQASLKGAEYQLWLQNQQTLYGAENLAIAPGYNKI